MRAKIKVISSSLIFKIISTLIAIVSISAIFVCNFSENRTEISADSGTYVGTFNGVAHYSSEFDADHTVNYLGMDCYIDDTNKVVYLTGIQTDWVDADTNPNIEAPYANCNTYNKFDMYSVRKHVVINAKIKYGNGLFANCGNLESIDIQSNADFSELESAYKMFSNCNNESLTSLDFSNADLRAFTSATRMFEGCSHVTKFTFDDNRLPVNLTGAYHMFNGCTSLTELDLSRWKINGSTDGMFEGCSALSTLTFSSTASTYNSTNAYHLFAGCSSLTSLVLSGWTINNCTTDSMFDGCGALSTLTFSSTANTYNSINAWHMFKGTALTTLDLSGWTITGTTDSMFEYSTNLSTVTFSSTANTYNSTNAYHLFKGTSITSLDLSGWTINGSTNGMFEACSALSTLTFSSVPNTYIYKSTDAYYMFNGCTNLTSLDLSSFDFTTPTSCLGMFSGCEAIKAINFGPKCTFEACTNFSWMFNFCKQLRYSTFTSDSVNTLFSVSMFDTSSATTMEHMFYYCASIGELNLGSFNTKLVTNAKEMFRNAEISRFTFGTNCTFDLCENMSGMFGDNQSLGQLDISNFNTAACTDISDFVNFDRNLTKITFPANAFSNCTNFHSAFYGLEEAKNIDFSKLNTHSAEDMRYMFAQSEMQFHARNDLATLDLSNFDTSNVKYAEGMFSNNTKPLEIIFGDDCTFANCTNFKDMFKNSSGIKKIDLSTFSIKNGANVTDMLLNTNGVHELIIKDTTTNVTINLNGTYHLAETKVNELGKTVVKKVTDTTYTQIEPSTLTALSYLIKEYNTETHEIKHEFTNGVCSICGYEDLYLGTYNGTSYHVSDITDSFKENDADVEYFNWLE